MKAKFTLEARVAGKYTVVQIKKDPKTKKQAPVPLDGASSYYVRFTKDGKRQRVSVGKDLGQAFIEFVNFELRQKASESGIELPQEIVDASRLKLTEAREKYFKDRQRLDSKTVYTYRLAIDSFISCCGDKFIEDVDRQDMIDFTNWLSKQPVKKRKHSNPGRTWANRVRQVAIFLKAFGKEKLIKKSEYPQFHKKQVVAHTDEELDLLYSVANRKEEFLLDFFIGTMVRDTEGSECRYEQLSGTTLTIYGKQHKTRTVEISPRLAAAIQARRNVSQSEYLFPNRIGEPDQHLLRTLQDLAKRAGAKFHTELHKLRKTGASRRYRGGELLITLRRELGHGSLEITQDYLADVRPKETTQAIAGADYIPKPKIVRSGTDGD